MRRTTLAATKFKLPQVLYPIELNIFEAAYLNSFVMLRWTTQTEIENFGFNIFRSMQEDGEFERINEEIIEGAGNSVESRDYEFVDSTVESGKTYYYKLQDIDFNGQSEFHGPISVSTDISTGVETPEVSLPTEYNLDQNYPNPFLSGAKSRISGKRGTTIQFDLPQASEVKLAVFNTKGQLVRTLVSEERSAGRHSVVWDGLNENGVRVATGLYLYRIEAANFVSMRKMILAK